MFFAHLISIHSILHFFQNSPASLELFQDLLGKNPAVFHQCRSSKALRNHWLLMRQFQLLSDQTGRIIIMQPSQSFFTSISIAHVRYIKILTWLWGFRVKIANFSRLHCLAIPRRDLSTKKTKPNLVKWPQSLGVILWKTEFNIIPNFVFHSPTDPTQQFLWKLNPWVSQSVSQSVCQ